MAENAGDFPFKLAFADVELTLEPGRNAPGEILGVVRAASDKVIVKTVDREVGVGSKRTFQDRARLRGKG